MKSPYKLIENQQLNFSFGILKSIGILGLCYIIELFFISIPDFFLSKNIINNHRIFLIPYEFILILILPLVWNAITGVDTGKFNIEKKVNAKTIVFLIISILGIRLVYDSLILPLVMIVPENSILKEASVLISNNPIYFFFSAIIYAPFIEEILFRGILLNGLLNKYSAKVAIPISAFLFAFIHLNFHQGVNAFILGLFLGFIFYKTKSLYLVIFCHFLNNFIALDFFKPTSTTGILIFTLACAIIGLILLLIVLLNFNPTYKETFEYLPQKFKRTKIGKRDMKNHEDSENQEYINDYQI
ncbi:hypothetical protein JCM1393_13500 [Clostridium carnis]